MEIKTIFRLGVANIELIAEKDEDLSSGVKKALEAIKNNMDLLKDITSVEQFKIQTSPSQVYPPNRRELITHEQTGQETVLMPQDTTTDWGMLPQLLTREDIPTDLLPKIIDISGEVPTFLVKKIPGSNRSERQMNAALIILFIMKRGRNVDEMTSNELAKILDRNAIDVSLFFNATVKMKQEKYVVAPGGKGTKSLKIMPPGETHVLNLLKNLHNEINQCANG